MLRPIQTGNALPYSWPADPTAAYVPGQLAQLKVHGNQIVVGTSDGRAPIGIIDEFRSKASFALSWDEEITVPATGVLNGANRLVSIVDIQTVLRNGSIDPNSFISQINVELIPRNGVIIFPAGTELNYDAIGSGTPNAIRTFVRYSYQIPNVVGDDSTAGSGRVTVHFQRGIWETDQIEADASYPLNAPLFSSTKGLFTTRPPFPTAPSIAIVTAPPTAFISNLQFILL